MVTISDEIQNLMKQENVVVVGTVDKKGMSNVSPRSSISWSNSYIYWLEFFDHTSRENFKNDPWVSVAVFDTPKQRGFQLKGKVAFAENPERNETVYRITQVTPKAITKIYDEKIKNEDLEVIRFEPHAIYSLDPRQEAGRILAIDKDEETISKLGE